MAKNSGFTGLRRAGEGWSGPSPQVDSLSGAPRAKPRQADKRETKMPIRRRAFPMRRLAVLLLFCGLSAACTQPVEIARIENRGDTNPLVLSGQLFSGDFKNLGQGEAIAAAIGNYKELDRPNRTHVSVIKQIKVEEEEEERERDLDGDGILDIDFVKRPKERFFDLETVKLVRVPSLKTGQKWSSSASIDRNKVDGDEIELEYAFVVLNDGDLPFKGKIVAFERLEDALTFGRVTKVVRVEDQRELKAGLSMIPYVGFIALTLSEFAEIEGKVDYEMNLDGDVIEFITTDVNLEPKQGVKFEFTVNYVFPDVI